LNFTKLTAALCRATGCHARRRAKRPALNIEVAGVGSMNRGLRTGLRQVARSANVLLMCLVAGFVATSTAYGREPQHVPGTSVTLEPPDGFVPASHFSGLMNPKTGAKLLVFELALAGYAEIAPGFENIDAARKKFARSGVTVETLSQITSADGSKVPVIVGTYRIAGIACRKTVALFKGARTVMVVVDSPEESGFDESVKAMLATVKLSTAPTVADKIGALPFTVQVTAPFRVVDIFQGSQLYMTVGELDFDSSARQPVVLISIIRASRTCPATLDRAEGELLRNTKTFQAVHIADRKRVTFANTTGILITGTYIDKGGTKRFSQYTADGGGGRCLGMVASVGEASADSLKPSIEAIAGSIGFKPDR
jgi:hypothetical protein